MNSHTPRDRNLGETVKVSLTRAQLRRLARLGVHLSPLPGEDRSEPRSPDPDEGNQRAQLERDLAFRTAERDTLTRRLESVLKQAECDVDRVEHLERELEDRERRVAGLHSRLVHWQHRDRRARLASVDHAPAPRQWAEPLEPGGGAMRPLPRRLFAEVRATLEQVAEDPRPWLSPARLTSGGRQRWIALLAVLAVAAPVAGLGTLTGESTRSGEVHAAEVTPTEPLPSMDPAGGISTAGESSAGDVARSPEASPSMEHAEEPGGHEDRIIVATPEANTAPPTGAPATTDHSPSDSVPRETVTVSAPIAPLHEADPGPISFGPPVLPSWVADELVEQAAWTYLDSIPESPGIQDFAVPDVFAPASALQRARLDGSLRSELGALLGGTGWSLNLPPTGSGEPRALLAFPIVSADGLVGPVGLWLWAGAEDDSGARVRAVGEVSRTWSRLEPTDLPAVVPPAELLCSFVAAVSRLGGGETTLGGFPPLHRFTTEGESDGALLVVYIPQGAHSMETLAELGRIALEVHELDTGRVAFHRLVQRDDDRGWVEERSCVLSIRDR